MTTKCSTQATERRRYRGDVDPTSDSFRIEMVHGDTTEIVNIDGLAIACMEGKSVVDIIRFVLHCLNLPSEAR